MPTHKQRSWAGAAVAAAVALAIAGCLHPPAGDGDLAQAPAPAQAQSIDPDTGQVSGKVLSADGVPIEGATIVVWPGASFEGADSWRGIRVAVTGKDGTYRIEDVPPGAGSVEVDRAPGHANSVGVPVVVPKGRAVEGVDFTLEVGRPMEGVILDKVTGAPIPDLLAFLSWGEGLSASVKTDSEGRWHLEHAPSVSSAFSLTIMDDRFLPYRVAFPEPGGPPYVTLLDSGLPLTISVVRDEAGGQPVPSYDLRVMQVFRASHSSYSTWRHGPATVANAEGKQRVTGLKKGMDVTVWATDNDPASPTFGHTGHARIDGSEFLGDTDVVLVVAPPCAISGTAVDNQGVLVPVAGIDVVIVYRDEAGDVTGRSTADNVAGTQSGPNGQFSMHGLPAGEYWLYPRVNNGARPAPLAVTLDPGESVEGLELVVPLPLVYTAPEPATP